MAGVGLRVGANVDRMQSFRSAQNLMQQKHEEKKQALIKKNYDEIYAHELAHKMAGGALAGDIVIEKNSQGIPFAGHVAIKMPTLDKNNPEKTIQDADTVIRSALAPSDPSGQDYKVAAQARSIRSQAVDYQHRKRLNLLG